MSSYSKFVASSCIALIMIAVGAVWAGSYLFNTHLKVKAASPSPVTHHANPGGPYRVSGNTILGADGKPYIFRGVGRDGLEYNCSGEGPLDQQHLAYMGPGANTATETYWGGNTIRLPLSEGFWLHGAPGYPCSAAQYQALVKRTVDTITALHLNAMLDLQWTDAAGQSGQGGGPWAMPDADSVTFWGQMARNYSRYSNVLFEVYNEPHPSSWSCWLSGCAITSDRVSSDDCKCLKTLNYQGVGMQALVNAVRTTGANNLVLVGGMNWGYDLSQIGNNPISGPNIVYDTHPYNYADKAPSSWDAYFGNISARYPVISAESGEYDCGTSYMGQLLPYLDAHHIGWMAWAWVVNGMTCSYPQVVTDYQGTPSVSMGQYIYQRMRGSAAVAGPVSKTWYLAEGRVGAGFKEYLTLDNPDSTNDCSVTIQYLLEGSNSISKGVTVPHATRLTESVNADLNIPYNQATGTSVSTIVTVNSPSPCNGVVVERPMYFSWHGVNSGSDVVGATHLGQNFYFGDVPTGSGYTSFITILNPPGKNAAIVTATYYSGGRAVGKQSVTVQPGQRGTIAPTSTGLPIHVGAILISNQPVMIERPDYFSNTSAGNAQTVTGAACVVGVQTLSPDWLFAEGYTGPGFQEYLAIANLDTKAKANATANVTIKLEYSNGSTQSYTIAVGTLSQAIWNVNQYAPAGSTVSAEVSSTGANIVVEREMFFQYRHTVNLSNGFQVSSIGGTDVIGQVGPAKVTSYSFAEGYNNNGYDEWLTLQNPTAIDESVNLTLVNGYGRIFIPASVLVHAHSRYTLDITYLILQNMVQRGDDQRGYEVSMTVQTSAPGAYFVAERPMYWNTAAGGTQGGSDVIGYTGA